MAVLTATGITFNDFTELNSKYGVLPQLTVAVFYQASAPTGWSQNSTHNDKALRVVNGTGGGFGFGGTSGNGGISFTSAFPSSQIPISVPISTVSPVTGTVGNTTLTSGQIPQHTHNSLTGSSAAAASGGTNFLQSGSSATGGVNEGSGGAHTHPWSGNATVSTVGNTTLDLRVQYIDVIVCSFN